MHERFAYRKKLIGTLLVLLLAGAGVFAVSSGALAQFIAAGPALIMDGVVTNVSGSQVTVQTDSTTPVVVTVGPHSVVTGGSLATGDEVRVVALRRDGVTTAQVIRITNVSVAGYGTSGPVVVDRASFVSDAGGFLTINKNGTLIRLQVTSSTHFVPNSQSLTPGQQTVVIGQDNGATFVARVVVGLH
jgi:hypothetical protein